MHQSANNCLLCLILFFFFKQKTAYEMRISDWSSDVCSSDLLKSEIVRLLEVTPTYYLAVVEAFSDFEFSTVVNALGELHEEGKLWQDDTGRICLDRKSVV